MASLSALLDEYDLSHAHPINIAIHWIAEPLAIFALMGLIHAVPIAFARLLGPFLALLLIYFGSMSRRLVLAMIPVVVVFVIAIILLNRQLSIDIWIWAAPLFAVSWLALLMGQRIERRVPSVFQNPNLIFVGPAWLIRRVFRRLGWPDP